MGNDNVSFGIRGDTNQLPGDLNNAERLFENWSQQVSERLQSVSASFEALVSGGGEIEITFNDADIQNAYDSTQEVLGRMEKVGDAAANVDGTLGKWGGKLGAFSGAASKSIGFLGSMANISETIVSSVLGWVKHATGFNEALTKSVRLSRQLADVQQRTNQRRLNAALEIEDPTERNAEIERLGRDARRTQAAASRNAKTAESKLPSSFLFRRVDHEDLELAVKNANTQLESANAQVESYNRAVERSVELEKQKARELDRQRQSIENQIALKEAEERGGKLGREIEVNLQRGFSDKEARRLAERKIAPDQRKQATEARAKEQRDLQQAAEREQREASQQADRQRREQERQAERELSDAERSVVRARRGQASRQRSLERFANKRIDLIQERDTVLGGFDRGASAMHDRIATAAATPGRDIDAEILAVDKEIAQTEREVLQTNKDLIKAMNSVENAVSKINTGML